MSVANRLAKQDLDAAQQDLAPAGRFAGATKIEASKRIAALTAERDRAIEVQRERANRGSERQF